MGRDIKLDQLAKKLKNYTGAEIEAVVKSASSFCFARSTNLMDFSKDPTLNDNSAVEYQDFIKAIEEIKP